MNRIFYALIMLAAFSSCAEQAFETYHIQGSSSLSTLDGSKLYLEIFKVDSLISRDSCEVVHGEFSFTGKLDTVNTMGYVVQGDNDLPVVMERGDIMVTLDKTGSKASGSPLNDLLYAYLEKQNQLDNRYRELGSMQARMLLEGYDEQTINAQLMSEAQLIEAQADSLQMNFITSNFDNILGPFVFRRLAQMTALNLGYPMITDQMEMILLKAPETFKNHPYVSAYTQAAKEFLDRMKGEGPDESAGAEATPQDAPLPTDSPIVQP